MSDIYLGVAIVLCVALLAGVGTYRLAKWGWRWTAVVLTIACATGLALKLKDVSFEITPSTAEVFVDGQYMGTVGQFTPTSQPLGLTPGRHHVEIRAPGYRTMDLDVDVIAGQVIPYQGALER